MKAHSYHERGAALIVALIILVVLTMLGLAGIQGVALEERMTGNTVDRGMSFQAAEAALRAGENAAKAQAAPEKAADENTGFPAGASTCSSPACTNGLCNPLPDDCSTPLWLVGFDSLPAGEDGEDPPQVPNWWRIATAEELVGDERAALQAGLTVAYVVEYLGNTFPPDQTIDSINDPSSWVAKRYRVTAISTGGGRATVMLQSIYAAE